MNARKKLSLARRSGWWILIAVAGLFAFGGIGWWFSGPEVSVGFGARVSGMTLDTFEELYPRLTIHMTHQARQTAVLYSALGFITLANSIAGIRAARRWAWYGTWAIVAAPIVISLQYLGGGLSFDNLGLLSIGALALLGQLLALPRRPSSDSSSMAQPDTSSLKR